MGECFMYMWRDLVGGLMGECFVYMWGVGRWVGEWVNVFMYV